jgi:hypothetical protein
MPEGVCGFFSVGNFCNNGIFIKPAWHYDGFIAKMFYQQVTGQGKCNSQTQGQQCFLTHYFDYLVKNHRQGQWFYKM